MASIQLSGLPETTTTGNSDYVHLSKSGIDYRITTENYSKGTFPIGTTLMQLPNKKSPSELGLVGTWENISSEFAGDFFRAEGGNASTFESGEQLDRLQGFGISGALSNSGSTVNGDQMASNNDVMPGYSGSISPLSRVVTSFFESDGTNGTPRTGIETNPVNHTIRIWERKA